MPNSEDSNQVQRLLLAKRRLEARGGLQAFATYIHPEYAATMGWHHLELIAALERIERGANRRLIISMPPRHAKSEFASVLFPCWAMGRNPKLRICQSGYSADIALTHSRHARDVFVSPEFRGLFPNVHHQPDREGQRSVDVHRQAASEWGTAVGGNYYAVGVGGGLTGREFDIGLIDDPVKDREAANSSTIRAKVLDWYRSTFYTRQAPGAAIIVIMTRWHVGDLAGVLQAAQESGDGEEWEVLELPAVKEGQYDALWPERYPADVLAGIKKAIGSHEWGSLYQQKPVLRGGNRFKIEVGKNIILHDSLEEFPGKRESRGWDLASSKKERDKDDPDWTWGVRGFVDTRRQRFGPANVDEHHIWISDAVYCREEAPARDRLIRTTAVKDGPGVAQHVEAFGGYKDAYTQLRDALNGVAVVKKSHLPGDKAAKLSPMEPAFEAGNVHMLRAPWNAELIKQLGEFPNGGHDDGPDALGVMFHSHVTTQSATMAIPGLHGRG